MYKGGEAKIYYLKASTPYKYGTPIYREIKISKAKCNLASITLKRKGNLLININPKAGAVTTSDSLSTMFENHFPYLCSKI